MRNSYIVRTALALMLLGTAACRDRQGKAVHVGHEETAPALNSGIPATIPAISPEGGDHIYSAEVNGVITYDTRNQTGIASRVGGRIERLLIKYNYQPVKKGQLIMEVYSPDLAAAQRELLLAARSNDGMLSPAKQRLQLLGMQPAQIEQVLRTGKILYRIPVYSNSDGYILEKQAVTSAPAAAPAPAPASSAGDGMGGMGAAAMAAPASAPPAAPAPTPVLLREGQYVTAGQALFSIYRAHTLVAEFAFPSQLAAGIRKGQQLLFYPVNNKKGMQAANVGLIEPVFRNGINFMQARVYVDERRFRPGELLTGVIPVMYRGGWWLPKKALWRSGNQFIVFKREKDNYIPVEVKTGAVTADKVQVMTDISDWKVASNAAYLVDSESFIKTN
jgi:Cu(I)/Ag(I) efflux system membrane fusion protein